MKRFLYALIIMALAVPAAAWAEDLAPGDAVIVEQEAVPDEMAPTYETTEQAAPVSYDKLTPVIDTWLGYRFFEFEGAQTGPRSLNGRIRASRAGLSCITTRYPTG